uniref:ABC transporter domain-containing protein n=3 Tax=Daucus carota subsp. sativus TaxID=79200 RepID=A0A165ZYC8_DAUCS|nr:PREDICTED: putative white-brown complex homolog protein 30 [Daucus carota subsp. sativus]
MSCGRRMNAWCWLTCILSLLIITLPRVFCIDGDDYGSSGSSSQMSPIVAKHIYDQVSNLTVVYHDDIKEELGYCIKDVKSDMNTAFNFSKDLGFINDCIKEAKGDITQRICSAAEMKFYFTSFYKKEKENANNHVLKPNKNCNLTSWSPGCEPGWACSIPQEQKADLKNSKSIPDRTDDCQPCCAGFFCPSGLTCMIPCPLGSYCPRATLNKTTGVCDPYHYQLPPGKQNHSCGGADLWGPITMNAAKNLFCSEGYYCPTTAKKNSCQKGHFCRKGSVAQKACFKMSTCNANTTNQNMHYYGLLVFGVVALILIIIYNCSDQVLSTRHARQAKSREAAARTARETAQARQRWKAAKDNASKEPSALQGLSQQLSRTFSRKTSTKKAEKAKASKKQEPSNLTKMLHNIEDDPDGHEDFHVEIGSKHSKKPKAKELHTRSQIFRYAYGQLEKEKAMEEKNQNMTFSGVISMATDTELTTRPPIEVVFKDLTLTLRKKHKHLMRCVYGKIMPGRISAVMGPSGAGKTTFLSAVVGRDTGCVRSGLILINGKDEPIQTHRKIIGFVPQDDIVHGNLTVEENLRFSARCRLSVDLPKADKVLVVERVIESLGLQAVRDSLVGTVEKRGISGGQRKRVNVGLEMVMEPSLLILDEPTTGLDSSSSNLLLRALRREALEGVNICMVVHQPSYALYKMFDDFILLAKGGLTVYHGSVKKVEEYFADLGIVVPDRVNPPDHFIDLLEGVVKLGPGLTVEQLPIRWMLRNGYSVPPDMMHYCDEIAASSAGSDSAAGEMWKDTKHNMQINQSPENSRSSDMSNRVTPGVVRQYRYFLGRVGKQRLREARSQAADFLILLLAGACLGTLAKSSDEEFGALGYTYTIIAVSLLCKISALRSFALDKLHYKRESSSGMNSLSYFLAKDTVDLFNTVVKPVVYLSMFYFFNSPRSSFGYNYIILLCLVYCVTGVAYIFAIFLDFSQAQLWCVLLPVVLTLISNQSKEGGISRVVAKYIYPTWALEAFVIANAERYNGVYLMTRCTYLKEMDYNLNDFTLCLVLLAVFGVFCRIVAFICLTRVGKK